MLTLVTLEQLCMHATQCPVHFLLSNPSLFILLGVASAYLLCTSPQLFWHLCFCVTDKPHNYSTVHKNVALCFHSGQLSSSTQPWYMGPLQEQLGLLTMERPDCDLCFLLLNALSEQYKAEYKDSAG